MPAKVKIGDNLKRLRQKSGFTLSEVASRTGMTAPALSYYERDEKDPSLEYAIRLADLYHVTLDELCGRSMEESSFCGLMRSFLNLRRNLPCSHPIQFDETHWSKSKQIAWEGDELEYQRAEEEDPGLRVMLKYATWVIHYDKLARFMESYEQLTSLVQKGQLDSSVLDIWLEKQLTDASSTEW